MNLTFLRFDSIGSTNTEALKEARLGADEGLCIVARQQTAGRGRQGRTWVSEKDAGLYLSIVLRPRIEAKFLSLIGLMSAIAVYDMLAEIELKPDLKWPNDVLVSEKKICGILSEATETEKGLAVIVGIGINLNSRKFPSDLTDTATSIEQELGHAVLSSEIEGLLVRRFETLYALLNVDGGARKIIDEWRRRSTYFTGKFVRVTLDNKIITGVTDGLESNGALRVRDKEGGLSLIQTGDVERLRLE